MKLIKSPECAFVCARCLAAPMFTRKRDSGAISWFDMGDAAPAPTNPDYLEGAMMNGDG